MTHTRINVLLIEDDPGDADFLRELLADATGPGFNLLCAERLATGLARLADDCIDVVLLDLSLPDSQGLATFTTLYGRMPDVPVVILTGLDDEAMAAQAVQAGAQDYLPKRHLDSDMLGRAIRYAIERKRAEREILDAHRQTAQMLKAIPSILIGLHHDLTITWWNTAAERTFGLGSAAIIGQPLCECQVPWDKTAIRTGLDNCRQTGKPVALDDVRFQNSDGKEGVLGITINPIESASDDALAFLLLGADITERRVLGRQLVQAQKLEAIGQLAAGIAHDFNNILGVCLGYTELALDDVPESDTTWGYLKEVMTAGMRAKKLVQQILTFSRQAEQERKPVMLHLIVKEVLSLLRSSLPSTIEIDDDIDKEHDIVFADPTQLHQILMNLGTNAGHAMRETGGTLEVRLEAVEVDAPFASRHEGQRGPHVRLTVRDTGHGIPPEVLKRIFEPFFTTKDRGEGTGLGLAVVYGIVADHEGMITASSTPGEGTTFEVYLPRHLPAASDPDPFQEPTPRGQACILFVDDEPALARLGHTLLTRLGYEVAVRTSSVEALEAFRAAPQRYDLVVTDQTMPQMTGEDLARELRCLRPDLPIIICTGFSHTLTQEKAQAIGLDAMCMKPLVMHELGATVRRVLDNRAAQSGASADSGLPDRMSDDGIAVTFHEDGAVGGGAAAPSRCRPFQTNPATSSAN